MYKRKTEVKHISSTQNQLIKDIVELKSKAKIRQKLQKTIIEGSLELKTAMSAGIEIEMILALPKDIEEGLFEITASNIEVISVSHEVMEKIALRESGNRTCIAVARTLSHDINKLNLSPVPFLLVLEGIEKPGNIGALIRTADAAGVDAILCCDFQTDIFNPNVIRNSLGCVFSKQIVSCTSEEAIAFCKKHQVQIITTYLHTDQSYYDIDMQIPTAIVMGTEATGVTEKWLEPDMQKIKIPMLGTIDSMNVSNSASIMLYEVVRQRRISKT